MNDNYIRAKLGVLNENCHKKVEILLIHNSYLEHLRIRTLQYNQLTG